MSYDAREQSRFGGEPFELYLFQTDTAEWCFTSSDEARTVAGRSYNPEAIKRTATSQGSELASGTITVSLPKDNPIAQMFVQYLPPSPLNLTILRGHDAEPEIVAQFVGSVTAVNFGDFCDLTCAPEQETLKKLIPAARYQKPCNRILYDAGCTIDKSLFRVAGTVTAVAGTVVTSAAFATQPDGWLTTGWMEKGPVRRMILDHTGDTVTLIIPLPGLTVGDSIAAFAGCKRDYATCVSKFSNGVHFFGFESIPGTNPFVSMG